LHFSLPRSPPAYTHYQGRFSVQGFILWLFPQYFAWQRVWWIAGELISGIPHPLGMHGAAREEVMPALIFDLDGTLIDTVYAHIFAWQRALAEAGMAIDGWRIHRRIGMSGGLFARAVGRELGRELSPQEVEALQRRHGELFTQFLPDRRPLPGACELLHFLRTAQIPQGIATSGRRPEINASLDALGVGLEPIVIERGSVARAKPEPDRFFACQERLGVRVGAC